MRRKTLQIVIALLIAVPLVGAAPAHRIPQLAAQGTCDPAPPSRELRFAVIGDYGSAGQPESDVAALVAGWSPDLILTVGDNNYLSGSADTIDANIGQYYHSYICPYTGAYGAGASTNKFLPALGNHDWVAAGAQPYLDYFELPGNERYYDYVQGPVHFFVLDSDVIVRDVSGEASAQAAWLQAGLGASSSPWNIVLLHHAPYSSSTTHGSTLALQWTFQAWGADAVIAGHDHTYERLEVGGIPYFVNGLGGYPTTYPFGTPLPESRVRHTGDYGAMLVDATAFSIRYRFVNSAGSTIDDYSVSKPLVPADFYVEPFATGLTQPVLATHAGDGSGRLFVVEQAGRIRLIKNDVLLTAPFLTLPATDLVSGGERGLLSLAFDPAYASNGFFYVLYTAPRPGDAGGSILTLKRFHANLNADVADYSSGLVLLTIDHPSQSNHNGGTLAFGPDGYLYWSTGDGGGGGDPFENAQDLTKLLGKILRLDVSVTPYAIPPGNPFYVDGTTQPELIWAYGLRNPWRMSFDRGTGDLYIGDVGQSAWEEIDFQPAASTGGENYGWDMYEADSEYNPPIEGPYDPTGKVFPVAKYGHSFGCSVTGGYVYRGTNFPSLAGHYFYGDFCSVRIWDLYYDAGTPGWINTEVQDLPYSNDLSSFGEGEDGSLYLVMRTTGRLLRWGYQDPAAFIGVQPLPADGASVCTTPAIGADLLLSDATRDAGGRFDLSKVKLRLDGTDVTALAKVRVAATHANSRAALLYTPPSPIAPGAHLVTLTYAAPDGPLTAAWDFTVTSGACTTSAEQLSAGITETTAPQLPTLAPTHTPAPDTADRAAQTVIDAIPRAPAPTRSAAAMPAQAVLPAPIGLPGCLPWNLSCPRTIDLKP